MLRRGRHKDHEKDKIEIFFLTYETNTRILITTLCFCFHRRLQFKNHPLRLTVGLENDQRFPEWRVAVV